MKRTYSYPFGRLFVTILSVFLQTTAFGQDPGLAGQYEADLQAATTDSARAMTLQYLAFNLAYADPERSVAYGEEALALARTSGKPWLLAQCQNGVGWAAFCQGQLGRARVLLDSSIQYLRTSHEYLDLASACSNQGWVYLKQGDNLGALCYFREGLEAAEASGDARRVAFMHRNLGAYYNARKEYEKAIPHISRAAEMWRDLQDTLQISDCLITLANAYAGLRQHETAIQQYEKVAPLVRRLGDPLKEGLLLENWGLALAEQKKFAAAFVKFEAARQLIEPVDEQIELAYLHYTIGSVYAMKGDTAQAIPSLETARRLAAELQLADVLGETLPLLHRAYAAIGWPARAYQTLLDYQTLRDTMAAETRAGDLQRLQTEFETERTEKDLQIKTLQNKRLAAQFWLAISGFGLALLAGGGAWYRARQRRRTNTVLAAKNEEILTQKAEADRLRARAEQSEAAKERFLAAMSHEIRTPMNAIVGLSRLLDVERPADPTLAHNISIIRQSGEHLMTILDEVLDLAKIEAQKTELLLRPVALTPLLNLVRDTFLQRALEKGLDLQLRADAGLPALVLADPVRLGQVLNNLVSNAIKFTETGLVTLSAAPVSAGRPEAITFAVQDTGIGIPTEKQGLVFEEFGQADAWAARSYGGTGLGLSIARGLVMQMGGALQLQSSPGKGSTFYFTVELPATAVTEVETSATGLKPRLPRLVCSRPAGLLLIEDHPFNQIVARRTLEAICPELEVEVVESGEKALEIVKTRTFDLILTDLQMPGIDGYETARRLRAAAIETPIVALTASALRSDEVKCRAAGMQEMLLKPLPPEELAALLVRYLPIGPAASDQAGSEPPAAAATPQETRASDTIPAALLHYAGGNRETARQLLGIIRTELAAHVPAIKTLRDNADAASIRRRVHKIRPQFQALGLSEHQPLLEAIDHAETADATFWENLTEFETVLEAVLARLSTEAPR